MRRVRGSPSWQADRAGSLLWAGRDTRLSICAGSGYPCMTYWISVYNIARTSAPPSRRRLDVVTAKPGQDTASKAPELTHAVSGVALSPPQEARPGAARGVTRAGPSSGKMSQAHETDIKGGHDPRHGCCRQGFAGAARVGLCGWASLGGGAERRTYQGRWRSGDLATAGDRRGALRVCRAGPRTAAAQEAEGAWAVPGAFRG